MTITIFSCGGPRPAPCVECSHASSTTCTFQLSGAKAGQTCGRALCLGCAQVSPGLAALCGVHARYVAGQKAGTP